MHQLLVTANVHPGLLNLFSLMMQAVCFSETSVLTRANWHRIPENKMTFFIVAAMEISNLA
jgi:hypothetical protein